MYTCELFPIFQVETGILRAELRGRQRDKEMRRTDLGMQESDAGHSRHRAPYQLCLQGQ